MLSQLNFNVPRFKGCGETSCDKSSTNKQPKIDMEEVIDTFELSKPKNPDYKEYIPLDATPQEVRDILADKKQVGRSFLFYKGPIKRTIQSSDNPKQAIANLNFLLNAENKSLPAYDINDVLNITEDINDETLDDRKFLQKKYGFEGGILTEESYKNIQNRRLQDAIITSSIFAQQLCENNVDHVNVKLFGF